MIKVVPDTNIIISAIFWKGNEYRLIRKGLKGQCVLILSLPIIEETVKKLKEKFDFPKEKTKSLVDLLLYFCHIVEPQTSLKVVEDPPDNKIIETAVEGNADYIVSGDNHLLKLGGYKGIKIVKAKELLDIL